MPHYLGSWLIFTLVILLLKQFLPTSLDNRLLQIPILAIFGIISFLIYIYINYKNENIKLVLGTNINNQLKKILK